MYRIEMSDDKVMGGFISINDVDYIDVFLYKDYAKFITNSTELYAELTLTATRSQDEEDFQCRIHKKTLASLATGDYLILNRDGDCITAEFYNEHSQLNYSCSFEQQVVAKGTYSDKMSLVESVSEGMVFDINVLNAMSRIAKAATGVVNVDQRVASVFLRNGARVYRTVETPLSFAITSKALDALKKSSSKVISIKDYLLAKNDKFAVLATKSRLTTNEEYSYLQQFGAKFVARVGLGSLFRFMNKLKLISTQVELHTKSSDCMITDSHYEYRVPISFEGAQLAPGAECDSISIPLVLLNGVLTILGYNQFDVRVTKNFTQFSADKYTVVW